MNTGETAMGRPAYKRKVKNYLLDVGLQLRYTATIVVIAVVLTAILGHRIYQATQDTSKVILWTGLVDPATAQELQSQFAQSDRTVMFGIIGFGIILVLSISGVGILLTHKVAGPLYKISSFFGRHPRQQAGAGAGQAAQGRRAAGLLSLVPRHAPGGARACRGRRPRARGRAHVDRGHVRGQVAGDPEGARRSAAAAQAQGRQPRGAADPSVTTSTNS